MPIPKLWSITVCIAYRAFHSTETAMTRVVNDLLVNVDSGSPSLFLSLDVSVVFDTFNHERSLQRAEDLIRLYR
jgi:hypothetical protein